MSEHYANSHRLRPALAADEPFLYALYASTRAAEFAAWGWPEAQQKMLLDLQFRAQQQHYAAYPNTAHWIIEAPAGETTQPIGRLLLARLTAEIRLVDIALLPDFRNRGLGAELVRGVQAEASQNRQAVRLHVAADSPARRFYTRLGFYLLEDRGTHWFMEWRAATNTDQRNETDYAG